MIAKVKLAAAVVGAVLVVGGGGGAVAVKLAAGEPASSAPVQQAAPGEIEALKKQLAEGNGKEGRYNLRPEAMCKLGKVLPPNELVGLLAPYFEKPNSPLEERNTAALVMGKFGGKEALPVLSPALAKGRDVAYVAALGLGLNGSQDAVAPLAQALKGAEPSVRFRAARSLGMVGGDAAEAALVESLESSDRCTRHGAALGLAGTTGAGGLAALKKALAEEDPLVRRGAAWALLQRKEAAALKDEARKAWDAPVLPPAYKPRNKQLADLADNTWVRLGGSPQEAGQSETQWCYDQANRLLFRQSGCSPYYSTEAWALDIGTMTWVKRRPYDDFYTKLVEPTVAPWKYSCLVGTCYDPDAKLIRLWGGTWHNGPRGSYDLAGDEYLGIDFSAKGRWAEAYNPIYDPAGKRCISFGGTMAGEMHCWDPHGDKLWNQKTATPGPGNNFPRYGTAAAVYEPESKLVVCFSFTSPTGHYSPEPDKRGPNETWTYDPAAATWRNAKPQVQPEIKTHGGLAYDSLNRAVILSIGDLASRREKVRDTQTWRYDVKSNTWTDLAPAGGGPGGPLACRLCFDPEHNVCIGAFKNAGGVNEVWAYRYKNVPVGTKPGEAAPRPPSP